MSPGPVGIAARTFVNSGGLPSVGWFTWTCNSQDAQPTCHHAAGGLLLHLLTISSLHLQPWRKSLHASLWQGWHHDQGGGLLLFSSALLNPRGLLLH